jgi:parallel beta-helix repeat protein
VNIRIVPAALLFVSTTGFAQTCLVVEHKSTLTLQGNCTTDVTLLIPDGKTLNLNGHTIKAVDPAGGFKGAVVKNQGARANVTNGTIRAELANGCKGGVDRLRGVLFEGASGSITNLQVLDIRRNFGGAISGCQEGNAIEVRNLDGVTPTVNAFIDGNTVQGYQKTGIVVNGDADGTVTHNTVTGAGPQFSIAQNGIQIGFGATGKVKFNRVIGNAYAGTSTVSGGILAVGGPGYGGDYVLGVQIQNNEIVDNDVGVYLSQYDASFNPPPVQTNIKVINNTITNGAVTNGYVYQAGVSDVGNNDKIINNQISGDGYTSGGTYTVDASYTNRPKVHANK